MDKRAGPLIQSSKNPTIRFDFMEYTKRRNLNRGYLKLEAWQRGLTECARPRAQRGGA